MQLSRGPVRGVLLCLTGAAVALTSLACTPRASGGVDPGDRVDAVAERITAPAAGGDKSSLLVPEGRLELVVTEPGETVPARDTLGSQDLSAASGARIVGIAWKVVPGAASTVQTALAGPGKAPGALAVLAGDQQFSLTEGEQWRRGAVFVAVPEDAELMVEVDYDTVTQRVDPRTGRQEVSAAAQPLYEEPGDLADQSSCRPGQGADPEWTATMVCWARGTTVSYVHDVGWAPEHEPWRVVQLEMRLDSAVHQGARYAATASSGTALLDGAEPALVIPREIGRGPGSISEYLVFPGSPGPHELSVTRTWSLSRESGPASAPDQQDLELTGSVEID
ncbi:hypothetical protein [Nocardioides sp.]|uniref:hypothetical protein n=1 Tax=Nocardioides sp. TaxID=35761 RepID=UPI002732D7B9|nr:hypothetical protein [Nocardioides sp.]MDP3893838.1 hypothetical protein [Nocardioides sp.]